MYLMKTIHADRTQTYVGKKNRLKINWPGGKNQ